MLFLRPFYIFAFIAIAIISAIIISCEETKETQNITNVEVENITKIYNEGFENTGFSIGSRGYGRLYYGKRKRYKGREVGFKVSYSDKPTKVITAMEGSSKYNTIIYATCSCAVSMSIWWTATTKNAKI